MSDSKTKELEEKIDELTLKVNRIVTYIDSDPATKRMGVPEQLDKLTDIVNKLLLREQVYKAKASTYGVIGGALVTAIWKIGTFLFTVAK